MTALKVTFDSSPASDTGGIGRYTRCLRDALIAEAAERGGTLAEGHRPRGSDVYHTPWAEGAPLRPRVPTVVTVHEVAGLKRAGAYLRGGLRLRLRSLAVQRATRVIVPTRTIAADAERLLELDPENLHVVPEAPDPTFFPRGRHEVTAARERFGVPPDYLLWVGGLRHPDPRKRIGPLTEVARRLPLVLVGDAGRWAHELPGVTVTGQIADEELAALYTGAHALVLPANDEGFGLSAVEALACGTPVVASDLPSLRDSLGERATFVSVDDLPGLVAAAEGASRPVPAPSAWSWADAAGATWMVYARAAGESA